MRARCTVENPLERERELGKKSRARLRTCLLLAHTSLTDGQLTKVGENVRTPVGKRALTALVYCVFVVTEIYSGQVDPAGGASVESRRRQ